MNANYRKKITNGKRMRRASQTISRQLRKQRIDLKRMGY